MTDDTDTHRAVREFYRVAANTVGCGGTACQAEPFGAISYDGDTLAELPADAVAASMGCGNPFAMVDLHEGEVVLDLGSGGGIDVLLSARRVGPTGKAYGLDMTPEMVDLARTNATNAGATNVEFLEGHMEDIPLPDDSVDVVISNCVLNLALDKNKVFAEIARVLRAGGRIGISDVIADDDLTPQARIAASWENCAAGALTRTEYETGLAAAGLTDIDITLTHDVGPGLHGAIIQATR